MKNLATLYRSVTLSILLALHCTIAIAPLLYIAFLLFLGNVPTPETALQPALLPPGASLPVPAAALPPRQSPAPWPVVAHGHEGPLLDWQQEP